MTASPAVGATAPSRRVELVLTASTLLTFLAVLVITMRAQHGTFTYAIDDGAIHLTLARNLVHGTFGVVPGTYQSASSAPIWEVLLAPFFAVSSDAWWAPLLLNLAAAAWLIRSFARLPLVDRMVGTPAGALAVAVLPIGLGWIPLMMIGMEHTLHAAIFAQLLLWLDGRVRGTLSRRADLAWYAVVALGGVLRFETMFVAVGLAVALVTAPTPRRRAAALTVAAAAVPIAAFGVINRAFGQYLLPNSVVAKTALSSGGLLPSVDQVTTRMTDDPLLLLLTIVGVALLVRQLRWARGKPERRRSSAGLVAVLVTVALHVCFADVGWFERYQAYLIVGLTVASLIVAAELERPRFGTMPVAAVVLVLSVLRLNLLVATPSAQYEIYEMQYHMGQFLSQAYDGQAVAVGDIGYVSWLHRGDLVDSAGLGSYEVLSARKDGRWGPDTTERLFDEHQVQVFAVYTVYFANGGELPGWKEGARWCVAEPRVVLSGRCVAFYAREGAGLDHLRAEMARFRDQVPDTVTVTMS